uniref:PH domain-containing protein n=1 Tax=Anopheles coluzzii TaxID=1518534 RepID=A0A8W7PUD0_ANOCL
MMQLQQPGLVADCVQFLKSVKRYLCEECEDPTADDATRNTDEPADEETYLNVLQSKRSLPGVRARLIAECDDLLERLETGAVSTPSLTELKHVKEADDAYEKPLNDEEDDSYIDMSGANTLKAANTSSSNVSMVELKDDLTADPDEPNEDETDEVPFGQVEENSYDLTTDQILYDECMQEVGHEGQEVLASTPTPRTPTPENAASDSQCPYGGLPASHLRLQQSPKHGTLFKQEKRLFFDQFKKYYVGLIGKWLLVYGSHNDLKPLQTIYIKCIKLDLSLNEQINEKHLFQIITQTDSKVHFLSPSFQDLNEWIVAIENNLIERVADRPVEECAALQACRKLPLPPCPVPVGDGKDEPDRRAANQVEDGIYEEPSLCLKTEAIAKAKAHGYDTPKPCCGKVAENVPVGTNGGVCSKESVSNSPASSKKPDLPAKSPDTGGGTAATPTPVKSWLRNRFNRSVPEPGEVKLSKKALKKLSFEELPTSEGSVGSVEPKSPSKSPVQPAPPSPKFTLTTTPTSKGTKINMIISQLEANGQLNLLSKRLNDTTKRYTWSASVVLLIGWQL